MKNLLFIISLLFSAQTYCQNRNQVNFSIGSAIPLFNFQDKDVNSVESGYAKVGRTVRLSYSREIVKKVAFQLGFLGFTNRLDNTTKLEEFVSNYPTTKFASIQTRAWRNNSLLFGISRKIQWFDGRFSIQPKVQAGCSFTTRPGFFISTNIDDQIIPESEIASEAFSLALMAGLSNSYSINEKLNIFITVDYFSTNVNFDFKRYPSVDKNSIVEPENISYSQEIRLLMISGGFSIIPRQIRTIS